MHKLGFEKLSMGCSPALTKWEIVACHGGPALLGAFVDHVGTVYNPFLLLLMFGVSRREGVGCILMERGIMKL